MLLFLWSLAAFAGEPDNPDMTIIVEDNRQEDIYVEPAQMICKAECPSEDWINSAVFIEAARKHKAWFKAGQVRAVYNQETIGLAFGHCDFKKTPLKCGKENGVWVLKTTVVQTENKASIQLMLFDDSGVIIGQGSKETVKKITVIEKQKIVQQQSPGSVSAAQVCPNNQEICATIPINQQGQTTYHSEDLEPSIIEYPPVLKEKHVSQAMIGVYDSIVK